MGKEKTRKSVYTFGDKKAEGDASMKNLLGVFVPIHLE